MLHRRSWPSYVPDDPFSLHPLARLSQLFEDRLKTVFTGLGPVRFFADPAPGADPAEIRPGIPASLLKAEVEALPADQHLVTSGQFSVHCARAEQFPWCLQEIGRLREQTFRAVGEGTGKASDVDLFDACYLHLFVWDTKAEAIVGAYRMGLADEIVARYGKRGLYTQSLFKYGDRVLQAMNPAIELGRSFVRVEYQRSFAPLMLLWRGIGQFIVQHPQYAMLFGAVSISNDYEPASRRLIVDYLSANNIEENLARHVKPRRPFRSRRAAACDSAEFAALTDIEDVSRMVRQIERDSKGVPILLKQYLKLGGRLLAFSADKQFNDALDGLIMVDLRASDPRGLARYMGEEGAAAFLSHNGIGSGTLRQAS
ncbi:MAG: GNAT family N-acetyltransferase [Betaproteobacteria bacterium]|nr:GNAT family N-acetyltransferase [Betaproteobacteria bacterium]